MTLLARVGAFLLGFVALGTLVAGAIVLLAWYGIANAKTDSSSFAGFGLAIGFLYGLAAAAFLGGIAGIAGGMLVLRAAPKIGAFAYAGYPLALAVVAAFWWSPIRPIVFPPAPKRTVASPALGEDRMSAQVDIPRMLGRLMYPESTVSAMSKRIDPRVNLYWPSITIVPPESVSAQQLLDWYQSRAPGGERKAESYRVETIRPGDNFNTILYAFRAKAGPEAGRMVVMFMTYLPAPPQTSPAPPAATEPVQTPSAQNAPVEPTPQSNLPSPNDAPPSVEPQPTTDANPAPNPAPPLPPPGQPAQEPSNGTPGP